MSMLTMSGLVTHVFKAPKGVTRDGDEYGGNDKVQLLCEQTLKNGESRQELFTLSCDRVDFEPLKGKPISVEVGAMVNRGNVLFYIPKGAKPRVLG